MKKLTILMVLLVSFSFVSKAQMNIGVKASLNMATISGDNTDETEMMPSYQVGLVTNFNISEAFSIQPGLMLSGKGSKKSLNDVDTRLTLNYLEVPINVIYNISDFQVFAGPYLGFGLFADVKSDNDLADEIDAEFKNDISLVEASTLETLYYNSFDYGLNVGAGYMVNESIQIQAGYGLGLGNIHPKVDGEDPNSDTNNSVIQLNVSYFF